MDLTITLKSSLKIFVNNFEQVTFPGYQSKSIVTIENLSDLTINPKYTYVFKGKEIAIVNGIDIDALYFN
ncbi:hypothetical protein [Macrococcus capreoli]|uniref:hypothetical protein n=1 Tax=Macrococcus capreoli TaxID=2982690 RepID=UPI003EE6E549